ncbi:hypothetical protein GIB67_007492 [Kingdonia uniflora]|uniref:No apical meristem-associated C-terminal domain-containing protein n=1 Tax=Kingdonia uniflora TaxID=39325 RepID=A0A7J7LW41_9MAGN|nr:hypothetical protein GIB67_007492 [Kingdonia uniflora]
MSPQVWSNASSEDEDGKQPEVKLCPKLVFCNLSVDLVTVWRVGGGRVREDLYLSKPIMSSCGVEGCVVLTMNVAEEILGDMEGLEFLKKGEANPIDDKEIYEDLQDVEPLMIDDPRVVEVFDEEATGIDVDHEPQVYVCHRKVLRPVVVKKNVDGERTVSSLKNHWSNMNRDCKVYGTGLKNVMQGPISGIQQGNLDDAAKTIYEARGKGKWLYKEAYEVLSCHQCWKILQDQHPDTLAHNVRMKQTSNSSPRMSTLTTPDTPVSSNTDSPILFTNEETERPGSIKSAKLKEKNEKRQNLLIERQNVLISRLDRMEKKK